MNIVELAINFKPLQDLFASVLIQGTTEDPLFKLSDVAKYIGDDKYNRKTSHFDSTMKISTAYRDKTQIRYADFLTEQGLYEYIMLSKTQKAKQFKDMIITILKQIRKQVITKLNNRLSRIAQEISNFPYPTDPHNQAKYYVTTWIVTHFNHVAPNLITYPSHIVPHIKSHIISSNFHLKHSTMAEAFHINLI